MKTINTKIDEAIKDYDPVDIEDRYPCWYATLEEDDGTEFWVVGVKFEGKKDECTIKIQDFDDYEFAHSDKCAIELIDRFRNGGEKEVKKWIRSNK